METPIPSSTDLAASDSPGARFGEVVIHRLVVAALAWRAFAIPIPYLTLMAMGVELRNALALGLLVLSLATYNVYLAWRSAKNGLPSWLRSRRYLTVEIFTILVLYTWATQQVEYRTFLLDSRNVLNLCFVTGALLWTGLLGIRSGLFVVASSAVTELTMALLNGNGLSAETLGIVSVRSAWTIGGAFGGLLCRALAHEGAKLVAREGLEFGRERERGKMLAQLHDTVLNSLEQALRIGEEQEEDASKRLSRILPIIRRQVGQIRRSIERMTEPEEPTEFFEDLCRMAIEFEARTGIRKEVVRLGEFPVLDPDVEDAVLGAVRAAMLNVEHHARAEEVNLLVEVEQEQLRLVVRDDGQGFDARAVRPGAFGIANCIIGRMEQVGGQARVHSTLGSGTRIELIAPLASITRSGTLEA